MTPTEIIERETGQDVTESMPLSWLDVDSLEFVDLVLTLNDETGKEVDFEDVAHLQTVGDLIRKFA